MSRVSPFDLFPQLLERKAHLVDMMVKNQVGVVEYRFWGAPTIDDAYGDPVGSGVGGAWPEEMFTVPQDSQYRSRCLIQRRWGWYGESMRGMTRTAWDPNDFSSDPATNFPSDDETLIVRIQERRLTAGWLEVTGAVDTGRPKLGGLYVVPPASFFGMPNPGLTLHGTAPAGTGAVAGAVPPFDPDMQIPNPMHIVLPRSTQQCFVNNTSANTLLCSTGWGIPMISTPTTEDVIEFGGGVKELVFAGAGGACTFNIYAVISLGPVG